LRDKSSTPEATKELTWHRDRLWWPIERVPLLLEVVHPRKLTALEWAILRVMEAFGDEPPSLEEVAEELGLTESAFLRDTLHAVVRLRALEPRGEADGWRDLGDLAFTRTGRELFRQGKIEGEPAEHGLELYFDALTDEDLRKPTGAREEAPVTSRAEAADLEPRSHVGLDRVRGLVRRHHPELLRGGGEVRGATPREGATPAIAWTPVDVEVRLTADGHLLPRAAGLSARAGEVLLNADLCAQGLVPPRGVTGEWRSLGAARRPPRSVEAWRTQATRTLAHDHVHREVLRVLDDAREEVLLHAGWCEDGAIRARVEELVAAGRRVVVLGTSSTAVRHLEPGPGTGLLVHVAHEGELPVAVVADRGAGVLLGDVALQVGARPATVELAGVMAPAAAQEVASSLLEVAAGALQVAPPDSAPRPVLRDGGDLDGAAAVALDDPAVRSALARFALLGEPSDLRAAVGHIAARAPGCERVLALVIAGRIVMARSPATSAVDAFGPALAEWTALVAQLPDQPGLAGVLAEIAPPGAAPEPLVDAALAQAADPRRDLLGEIIALRAAVDARWGPGTCERLSAFTRRRDELLRPGGAGAPSERVAAARALLEEDELVAWARAELDAAASPSTGADVPGWVDRIEPLAAIVPAAASELVLRHTRRLLSRQRDAQAPALRAAARLVPGRALLGALAGEAADLAALAAAWRALVEAEVEVDRGALRASVEAVLPTAPALPTASAGQEDARALAELGREAEVWVAIGHGWAARWANALTTPTAPEELLPWFEELGALRALLPDLRVRAGRPVARLRVELASARERDESVWLEVCAAWEALGLPVAWLVALVHGASATNPGAGVKVPKKRKRDRSDERERRVSR